MNTNIRQASSPWMEPAILSEPAGIPSHPGPAFAAVLMRPRTLAAAAGVGRATIGVQR